MPIPENLPKEGQSIFESVMSSLKGKKNPRTGKSYTDEERGKIAWSAVKNKFKKVGEKWEAKTEPDEDDFVFSEAMEFKSDDGKYYFKGYLSTFDIDLVNDLVTPDCMKDMLEQINAGVSGSMRSMKGSPDHDVYFSGDPQRVPFSKITKGLLDDKGLFVEGMFNSDHPDFMKKWSEIQNGFYDGLSIEYKPVDFTFKELEGKKIRVLNRVQLKGYGHTPRPANPSATLTEFFVKSLEVKEAEEIMEAKGLKETITSHLHEDMKEYEKMIEDDKRLLEKLGSMEDVKEEPCDEKEKESAEEEDSEKDKKMEESKVEEKKEEVKTEPQPTPQTEVKQVEAKVDEIKALEEKIRAIVKEEIKSLVPEKKDLSDTTDKFEVKAQSPQGIVDYIVKGLGGK